MTKLGRQVALAIALVITFSFGVKLGINITKTQYTIGDTYIVSAGDTMHDIITCCAEYDDMDYRKVIYDAEQLNNKDLSVIHEGQNIILPNYNVQ